MASCPAVWACTAAIRRQIEGYGNAGGYQPITVMAGWSTHCLGEEMGHGYAVLVLRIQGAHNLEMVTKGLVR